MENNTPDNTRTVTIAEAPVELYKILKIENLVASGGEAKHVIAEGLVMVNGKVELRKRKKIVPGDLVEFTGIRISVRPACP